MPDELPAALDVTRRPSKKQYELLAFIEGFVAEHGYGPSYREIMRGCDYKSVSTVAVHVDNLISRGQLRKRTHSARSLEVVKTGSLNKGVAEIVITVSASQEKWLVDIVNLKFADYQTKPSAKKFDNLCILVAALSVIGMKDAAVAAKERLKQLA